MTPSDFGLKWTRSPKRLPPIRVAGGRTFAFACAVVAAAALLPPMLGMPAMDGRAAAALAGLAFAVLYRGTTRAAGGLRPPDRRRELEWLAIACMASFFVATDRLDPYGLPYFIDETLHRSFYPWALRGHLPLYGFLFVSLSWGAAISIRLRQARQAAERSAAELRRREKELERLERTAKRMEELRAAELEQASRSWAASFRKQAEAIAEISVIEERSRIAQEIHDVVGHTLTAAIVQLEATKKIAERQDRVPWDKLELVSGIVRKGLDDIRRAVKLMSSDDVRPSTLEAALRELIQYTADTMEIAIDADISLPSNEELGKPAEQALYHALQEGLTNGIRHGKCTRARFSLHAADGMLRFRLVSDGEPYGSAVPGFGLSSMSERVKLLGGRVDVRSSADEDGTPVGCELAIELPLAG